MDINEPNVAAVVADLVLANRILYARGVVDAFGHVSARHPLSPGHMILSRSMAPGTVTVADMQILDLEGNVVGGDWRQPYLERFIHGRLYAARPDIGGIVHCHSPSVLPFAAAKGSNLRATFHMAGFLGAQVPLFEIRDHLGDVTDLLVRDNVTADHLATCLGCANAVLMRGHGATVVGRDAREAVFRAVFTEVNARIQLAAMSMAPVTYLTEAEAAAADATNSRQIDRAWLLWVEEVGLS